jgi:hypothetical protein
MSPSYGRPLWFRASYRWRRQIRMTIYRKVEKRLCDDWLRPLHTNTVLLESTTVHSQSHNVRSLKARAYSKTSLASSIHKVMMYGVLKPGPKTSLACPFSVWRHSPHAFVPVPVPTQTLISRTAHPKSRLRAGWFRSLISRRTPRKNIRFRSLQ